MYTYQHIKTVTSDEIYKHCRGGVPTIPAGYKFVDFRPGKIGDYVIAADIGTVYQLQNPQAECRIIVERVKRRKLVFEATGEFRKPTIGEFFFVVPDSSATLVGGIYKGNGYSSGGDGYEIMRLVSNEQV